MKNPPSCKRTAIAILGATLLAAGAPALADPPSRIARLAYVSGPVSLAPAGENDWENAALNRPLIAGDRLWVDNGARDEVQVGAAALRMGGNTLVTLQDMDDRLTRLQLSQGRLNLRVRRLAPNEVFEIDTPNLALTIRQPGDYRIEVDPAGDATMVAVRRGQADVYGSGNAYRLGSGQAYQFGGIDLRDARAARAGIDEFDRWAFARERRLEQSRAARYVSPSLLGYEDLDEQGTWRSVPSYGNVWMPANVGRDWAPYRDGHWSYVQPWGWTWVDDAPWGFAVSHYGRWARFPQGWGWVPGPRAASAVYAPALVAFVSIGNGAYAPQERPVAWFPLAPREVYRPSYRASPTYITNINITNTTLVRNQIARESGHVDYANRRVGGAVTAVPQSAFARAQPVSKSALALPMAALAGAAIVNAAPVAPERGAVHGRGNGAHQPPPAVLARQGQAPAPAAPNLRHAPPPVAPPLAAPPPPASDRSARRDEQHGARDQRPPPPPPPLAHAPAPTPPAAVPVPPNERAGRRDEMRERRDQRPPPPLAHAPMAAAPAAAPPVSVPLAPNDRTARRDEMRQRPPAPLAHAPTPAAPPVAAPVRPSERAARRDEMRQGREQRPPSPPPLAHAPTPLAPPAAAAPVPPNDRAGSRDERRQMREQQRQERPAPQAAPAPPRPPEPPALRHAPTPAPAAPPRPAEPPKPDQARGAPAQQQAGQHGNEGKKGDKRDRERPQND